MTKNSVKYLQGISFLQLAVNEKKKIKNLGGAIPDTVIPQNFCDNVKLLCMLNMNGWVAVLKEILNEDFLINRTIILAPKLPQ